MFCWRATLLYVLDNVKCWKKKITCIHNFQQHPSSCRCTQVMVCSKCGKMLKVYTDPDTIR